jgi:DNA replication protein DnaC
MFQVVSSRHDEDLGTIVTTNIPFGEWNQIFASNAIAHAVIDRLTDNASVFYVEGPSYREERSKKRS